LVFTFLGNQIEIAPGAYQYNFQAVLPPMLPTSFEAKHGSIRYLVNVVIDRPWKFDLTYKNAFTVLKQLDLNYENPALKIPTKMEVIKTFYCGFCKTAPLFVAASVPMSGYVAGQTVEVSIEINNQSRIDIDDVKVSLNKLIYYNSQTPRKHTKEEIITETEIRGGSVKKQSRIKLDQKILIPPVPPSNMNYCRVLNVAYEIHVTAKVGGVHKNPTIKIPLTIGTVPLNVYNPVQHGSAPSHTPSPTSQLSFSEALARQMINQNSTGILRKTFHLPKPSACFTDVFEFFSSTIIPRNNGKCSAAERRR
jgi:Arrestin (or S-antigen), C-terminal domain/Arrestin (or S-antigen), N-terminal domain